MANYYEELSAYEREYIESIAWLVWMGRMSMETGKSVVVNAAMNLFEMCLVDHTQNEAGDLAEGYLENYYQREYGEEDE